MAREFAKAFYDSAAWHKCRRSFIAMRRSLDGGLCEDCREKPGRIVHHIVNINENNIHDPDVTLNHHNLRYVCQTCHDTVEHCYGRQKVPDEIEYFFDENGNPVPRGG